MAEPNTALCCSDHTEEESPEVASNRKIAENIVGTLVVLRKISELAGLSFRDLSNQAFYRFVNEEIEKAQAGKVKP